jgi:hypothetical protein
VITATADSDRERVEQLLGRAPRGSFTVVVRDARGSPVVIRNAPLLDDGTPMPTRYWLVGPEEVRAVSRLEAAGGVAEAEATISADEIAAAHNRYAVERDTDVPPGHHGPVPSGGVGGTRQGVKCLHAHYAWHLAGGDDPVGRWVAGRIGTPQAASANLQAVSATADAPIPPLHLRISPSRIDVLLGDTRAGGFDIGPQSLVVGPLAGHDPPRPEQLTNALGEVADEFEDLVLAHPEIADITDVSFSGDEATALARVEAGVDDIELPHHAARTDLEEVFRVVATETSAQRRLNPGLPAEHVETIVATCCIVLAVMRRLHLDEVSLS